LSASTRTHFGRLVQTNCIPPRRSAVDAPVRLSNDDTRERSASYRAVTPCVSLDG
jgi:hypothetical protein